MMYPHYPVFLTRREVERRTGLSCSTIYKQMAKGKFPRQVKVGTRGVRWIESDIAKWMQLCLRRAARWDGNKAQAAEERRAR